MWAAWALAGDGTVLLPPPHSVLMNTSWSGGRQVWVACVLLYLAVGYADITDAMADCASDVGDDSANQGRLSTSVVA
jgi:hypothetical protein